jgi:hypothetical protein
MYYHNEMYRVKFKSMNLVRNVCVHTNKCELQIAFVFVFLQYVRILVDGVMKLTNGL